MNAAGDEFSATHDRFTPALPHACISYVPALAGAAEISATATATASTATFTRALCSIRAAVAQVQLVSVAGPAELELPAAFGEVDQRGPGPAGDLPLGDLAVSGARRADLQIRAPVQRLARDPQDLVRAVLLRRRVQRAPEHDRRDLPVLAEHERHLRRGITEPGPRPLGHELRPRVGARVPGRLALRARREDRDRHEPERHRYREPSHHGSFTPAPRLGFPVALFSQKRRSKEEKSARRRATVRGVPDETRPQVTKRQAPPCLPLNAQLAELAGRQHGVVTTKQLGMTSGAISKRARAGTLHRVHRGVYAVGHARLSEKGAFMAAVLAAGQGAALCGLSAAVLWQAWRRKVHEIHVLVPRDRRPYPGFRIHTTRHLHPSDITTHDGIPVTTIARTLVDLTDTLTTHQLANVIHEAAFRNRYNRQATLAALIRANGRRNLNRLAQAIQSDSPGTRSDLEDRFLSLIADLPQPRVNTKIAGLEVDFAYDGLVIEIDGPGHRRPRTQREDQARDAKLRQAGYEVIRIRA